MIQQDKYLREPYRNIQGDFQKEVKIYPSPDKQKNVVISHCWEYRMGANTCLFHLTDNDEKIIEDFAPHTTHGILKWKDDSNMLAIAIGEVEPGILIMNIEQKEFALIKTRCFSFEMENNFIRLFIHQKHIDILNTKKLFGGGKSELPRVKYQKPEDFFINLSTLKYYKKDILPNIFELDKEEEINPLPIEDGFWKFNGRLPMNTYDGFNNRDFEVYQLEAFAKYGDEQSIKWLEEIKSMNQKKYNKWSKVSYYLGKRERK